MPGSGKSTAIHYINIIAREQGYTTSNFNDYNILREWFEAAPDGPDFSRAACNGFDIHNLTLFDTSLQELERRVLSQKPFSDKEIITIEFARNDYAHAMKQFSSAFLQDAYFLFINAENVVCKKRIRKRAIHQRSVNDHFVSDYIFDTYYYKGSKHCIYSYLRSLRNQENKESYATRTRRLAIINNIKYTLRSTFYLKIRRLTLQFLKQQDVARYAPKQKVVTRQNVLAPAKKALR